MHWKSIHREWGIIKIESFSEDDECFVDDLFSNGKTVIIPHSSLEV
jgi:hypothetical protein